QDDVRELHALGAVEGHDQRCAAAVAGVAVHGDDAQAAVVKGAHQGVAGLVEAGEHTDRRRVATVFEDLLAPAAYQRRDLFDLVLQVGGGKEGDVGAGAEGAEGAGLAAVGDLVAGQVVVLHGGDVE